MTVLIKGMSKGTVITLALVFRLLMFLVLPLCIQLFIQLAHAVSPVDMHVSWKHSPSIDVVNYRVYYGTSSNQYTDWTDVGYVTNAVLGGFETGIEYFFAVTAWYDCTMTECESDYSNEASILKHDSLLDEKPPAVQITWPSNQAKVLVKESLIITVSAVDDVGVVSVSIFVNDQVRCALSVEPFQCTWKVPASPGKSYLIEAEAVDSAGNVGISPPVQVTTSKR